MDDAIFKIPTTLVLSKVIDSFDVIYRIMGDATDKDIRGNVYEYLLSKISQSGRNGQFRTPRHIIRMMVELTTPQPDDIIYDPVCGTSGFLVAAGEYLRERYKEEVLFDSKKKEHYMSYPNINKIQTFLHKAMVYNNLRRKGLDFIFTISLI